MNELTDRELDAAIAQKVMGWQRKTDYNYLDDVLRRDL